MIDSVSTVMNRTSQGFVRLLRSVRRTAPVWHAPQLEQLFHSAHEAMAVVCPDGRTLQINSRFVSLFGYTPADVIGRPLDPLLSAEQLSRDRQAPVLHASAPNRVTFECIRRRKDGSSIEVSVRVWVRSTQKPLRHGTLVMYRDISAVRRADEARRNSAERHALLLRGASVGLWDWNLDTDVVYLSARWKEILGYSDRDIGSRPASWFRLLHRDDVAPFQAAVTAHLSGRSEYLAHEQRLRTKGGEYRWMLVHGVAGGAAAGRPRWLAGSLTEITHRNADAELRREPQGGVFVIDW